MEASSGLVKLAYDSAKHVVSETRRALEGSARRAIANRELDIQAEQAAAAAELTRAQARVENEKCEDMAEERRARAEERRGRALDNDRKEAEVAEMRRETERRDVHSELEAGLKRSEIAKNNGNAFRHVVDSVIKIKNEIGLDVSQIKELMVLTTGGEDALKLPAIEDGAAK